MKCSSSGSSRSSRYCGCYCCGSSNSGTVSCMLGSLSRSSNSSREAVEVI